MRKPSGNLSFYRRVSCARLPTHRRCNDQNLCHLSKPARPSRARVPPLPPRQYPDPPPIQRSRLRLLLLFGGSLPCRALCQHCAQAHFAYTEFLKENRRAASTIKTDLAAIRFFYDQLPSRKHPKLPTNAMLDPERRSFGKIDRTWRDEEVNRMIDKAWGKGGKVRTVPLPRTAALELEAMLRQTPREHKLFVSDAAPTDLPINRFQRFLYRHRQLICHGLQHTYAKDIVTQQAVGKGGKAAKSNDFYDL